MHTKDNCLSESKDDQPLTLSFLFFSIHFYFEGEILFNERERERKKEKEKKRSFVVQEKKNVILLALNSQINLILKRKKKKVRSITNMNGMIILKTKSYLVDQNIKFSNSRYQNENNHNDYKRKSLMRLISISLKPFLK